MTPRAGNTLIVNELRKRIKSGAWPGGTRLPSIRDLAQSFGVGIRAIRNALSRIENEGLIERRPRSGIYALLSDDESHDVPWIPLKGPKSRTRLVAESIIEDISRGNFRAGDSLPSRKELRFRYKTSPLGLAKALGMVEKSQLVHRKGTSLVAGPDLGSGPSSRGEILVFANQGDLLNERQATLKFLTAMEQHASASGIRVEPRVSWNFGPGSNSRFLTEIPPRARAIVCLLGSVRGPEDLEARLFQNEVRKALQAGLPVLLFGIGTFPNTFHRSLQIPTHNLFLFQIDNEQAGEEAASFALAQGHRHMAYFSFSNEEWNHGRFRGVSKRVRIALGESANPFHHSVGFDKTAIQTDRKQMVGTTLHALTQPVKDLLKGYEFSHSSYYWRIAQNIYESATVDIHWPHLEPIFEKALKNRRTTIWICADSSVAQVAADFLKRKELQFPENINLMALDDRPEMMRQGITSHAFNWDRMGYLAAHTALQDIPIRRKRNRLVVCPHAVIDRGSVGRV